MIRQIQSFIDEADAAAPFVKSVLSIAEGFSAHTQIGVLTAAPMLIPALAPLGTLYLPEAILGADNARQVEQTRMLAGPAASRADIWGLHDSVGWLAADIRDTWHLADLTLIGPGETWRTPWLRQRLIETLLLSSGTPLIMLPSDQRLPRIRHAVLGWKPSAEACRVLHDLMILAEPNARIDVVSVGPEIQQLPGDELPGSGIEAYLARHGFAVEMHRFDDGGATGDQLQAFALSRCADVLAVGGVAHSRVREIILGGVTRSLIQDPALPVLLSHLASGRLARSIHADRFAVAPCSLPASPGRRVVQIQTIVAEARFARLQPSS